MLKHIFLLISFLFVLNQVSAQKGYTHRAKVVNGDTLLVVDLKPVYIVEYGKFESKKAKRKYTRLVRYVKKVYPYAKLAAAKLNEYEKLLKNAKSEKEKKKLMKRAEKELRKQYEGKLRDFTITQGKILIKLIDRETQFSSYELLKYLRNGLYASIWQGVGKVFSYDLKERYDPKGKDRQIEQIVQLIEAGAI
jgi:hypothetical protein